MIRPARVFIDKDLDLTPEIDYLISKVTPAPEKVSDSRPVYDLINQAEDPAGFAKKILYITTNKGCPDPPVPRHQLLYLLWTTPFCTAAPIAPWTVPTASSRPIFTPRCSSTLQDLTNTLPHWTRFSKVTQFCASVPANTPTP